MSRKQWSQTLLEYQRIAEYVVYVQLLANRTPAKKGCYGFGYEWKEVYLSHTDATLSRINISKSQLKLLQLGGYFGYISPWYQSECAVGLFRMYVRGNQKSSKSSLSC